MVGRFGTARAIRPDDQLGHLVPPGQLLPADVLAAITSSLDGIAAAGGDPASHFVARMHPADRAWLPAGFARTMTETATRHADERGMVVLDGIRVSFQTDPACEMGTVSVRADVPAPPPIVLDALEPTLPVPTDA